MLSSCSHQPAKAKEGRRGNKGAIPVLVAQAETRDVPVEIQAIGTAHAFSLVSVRSQITGPITQVHFHEGQEVKAGDLLFTIDPRPWQAALNQAEANLQRAKAQLLSSRLDFERTSNLFATKIASREDYDTAQAAYQAQAATVVADEAAISNAQVSLGYTEIRSPIDGHTGNLTAKQGNVVKAPDDVLVTLTQTHPIYVSFAVPERQLPVIRREMRRAPLKVRAVVPGDVGHPVPGQLTFINNQVDTSTGTILLKATFDNTNEVLWPGQFVQVSLTLSNLLHAVVVPTQAVQTGRQGEFIFVVQSDHTVKDQPVTTSVTDDGRTVITSGIQPGQTVVTDGQLRLEPGTKVDIKTASAAGLAPAEDATED